MKRGESSMAPRTVRALYVYPIKSVRGVAQQAARVAPRGLVGDRRWMLVDASGRFVSQREEPRLAHVKAEVSGKGLEVCVPGEEPFEVRESDVGARRRAVRIWKDSLEALPAPESVNNRFSRYLKRPVQLVWMDAKARWPVDPAYGRPGEEVSFADGYPLLLTTRASLNDLNARLDAPLEMRRFRPNLVVDGQDPFEEDRWRRIQVGAVWFRVVKPCARCVVTTIDPDTAEAGKEPLRTLASFRRWNGKVYFGQNLIPEAKGLIREGDPVTVLEWSDVSNLPGTEGA